MKFTSNIINNIDIDQFKDAVAKNDLILINDEEIN